MGYGLVPVLALALCALGWSAQAQEAQAPALTGQTPPLETLDPGATAQGLAAPPAFPMVLVNQERLLSGSLYGQRIQREVEAVGSALAAENRRIEAQLTEEELVLTERRTVMTPSEFRPLALEFDSRVEGIRAAQEAKSRALQAQAEAAQLRFFEIAFPILVAVLESRGAAVLMDSRAVLLAAEGVDITDEAIARIDAAFGDGGSEPLIDLDGTGSAP